jgi:hypothetical protein
MYAALIGIMSGTINGFVDSRFLWRMSPLLCCFGSWQCESHLRHELLEAHDIETKKDRFCQSLALLCSWVSYLLCFEAVTSSQKFAIL